MLQLFEESRPMYEYINTTRELSLVVAVEIHISNTKVFRTDA